MPEPAAAEGYLIDGLRVSIELGQIQESVSALCDIATARALLRDLAGALRLVDAVIAHPASDPHQRYNPKSIREIAQERYAQFIESGAILDASAPLLRFDEVVASLLEGSKSIHTAAS
jgi:alkylhydroperoxidase family enzyme